MDIKFSDIDLEELINTGYNKKYKKYSRDKKFMYGLARVYKIMQVVPDAEGLGHYSFLHYEKLAHDPRSSIRIVNGKVERLLFTETEDGVEVELIEIDSTHYGNKK